MKDATIAPKVDQDPVTDDLPKISAFNFCADNTAIGYAAAICLPESDLRPAPEDDPGKSDIPQNHPSETTGMNLQADQPPAPCMATSSFDLPLATLSYDMQTLVMELVEGRAIDAITMQGQTFVRTSELVHYSTGDWPPEEGLE